MDTRERDTIILSFFVLFEVRIGLSGTLRTEAVGESRIDFLCEIQVYVSPVAVVVLYSGHFPASSQ